MIMLRHVLGIDPSLTATGLAWIPEGPAPRPGTDTLHTTGHRGDTVCQRAERIDTLEDGLCLLLDRLGGPDGIALAVMEGPSMGSVGGSSFDRAGLWWAYALVLLRHHIPLAICAPTTRIKWATGSGRATESTKSDVAVAMVRMWSNVTWRGDNESDALCLAQIGAQHLDWPVPHRAHHRAAQTAIVWPTLAGPLEATG